MAINSYFLGVCFMGEFPNEACGRPFVVFSWIPPWQKKNKTKQNKNKTCKLVPLLRVKIVQFLNRVGSSLQQTWGKRWSSWKSTWKVLFFWLFFGFFFKVNQPQSPDVENTKLKSPLVGGSVFQDLLAPGSVAAFYAPGREGRDGIFYLIFLPSLGGEGTPPLWLCFSSETTATTPSKPTQSPADDSSWCVSLKTPKFPLDWSEIPSVFQLNFPPKASKSQPFYPPPVAFLREQQMGLWTFLQLLSLLPLILSPPELFCDQLCPFFCLFCTELFFFLFGVGKNSDFLVFVFFFSRQFPLAALLSQGESLWNSRGSAPSHGSTAEGFNSNNAAKTSHRLFFQRVYFFNSFCSPHPPSPLQLFPSPPPWSFFSLFGILSEVFHSPASSVFVGEPRERSV